VKTPKSLLLDVAADLVRAELEELLPEMATRGEFEQRMPVMPIQDLVAMGKSDDVSDRRIAMRSLGRVCELLSSFSRWLATPIQPMALAASPVDDGKAPAVPLRYRWSANDRELEIERFPESGGRAFRYRIHVRLEEAERLQGALCHLRGFSQSASWRVVGPSQIEMDLVVPVGDHKELPESLVLDPDPKLVHQLVELLEVRLGDPDDTVSEEAWQALQYLRGTKPCLT
jgi:hypothetical protein